MDSNQRTPPPCDVCGKPSEGGVSITTSIEIDGGLESRPEKPTRYCVDCGIEYEERLLAAASNGTRVVHPGGEPFRPRLIRSNSSD